MLTRSDKATFGGVFGGQGSRRFAEQWDRSGFDPELVDPDALREAWLAPSPDYGLILPLLVAHRN